MNIIRFKHERSENSLARHRDNRPRSSRSMSNERYAVCYANATKWKRVHRYRPCVQIGGSKKEKEKRHFDVHESGDSLRTFRRKGSVLWSVHVRI